MSDSRSSFVQMGVDRIPMGISAGERVGPIRNIRRSSGFSHIIFYIEDIRIILIFIRSKLYILRKIEYVQNIPRQLIKYLLSKRRETSDRRGLT